MVVHAWYPRTDSDLSISLQLPPPSCDTLCAECRPVFGPTATFLRHYALCRPVFGARYRHPLVTLCAVSPLVNSYPIYAARSTAVYAARSQYACNLANNLAQLVVRHLYYVWLQSHGDLGRPLTAQHAARLVFRFRPHTSQRLSMLPAHNTHAISLQSRRIGAGASSLLCLATISRRLGPPAHGNAPLAWCFAFALIRAREGLLVCNLCTPMLPAHSAHRSGEGACTKGGGRRWLISSDTWSVLERGHVSALDDGNMVSGVPVPHWADRELRPGEWREAGPGCETGEGGGVGQGGA